MRALIKYRYGGHIRYQPVVKRSHGRSVGRTSLLDLIVRCQRYEERGGDAYSSGQPIWIVCDADARSNEPHRVSLEGWLAARTYHYAAIQANAIEGWILSRYKDTHPGGSRQAREQLKKVCPGYAKGAEVSAETIAGVDDACERERRWARQHPGRGVWPGDQYLQMPDLVAFLDDLVGHGEDDWVRESVVSAHEVTSEEFDAHYGLDSERYERLADEYENDTFPEGVHTGYRPGRPRV